MVQLAVNQLDPAGGRGYRHCYIGDKLPLTLINVLDQPRKTFEHIPELAQDVANKGLLNPIIVAKFSREQAKNYLGALNELWRSDHSLADLVSYEGVYYILLAGERRFRSCLHLWRTGCADCLDKFGDENPGRCFRRHFHSEKVEVRLCNGIPPLNALFLQLSENTHMRVPQHEEAQAYYLLFSLLRQKDPKYPVARFAREVGRSPGTITDALRFCDLPISIRVLVEEGPDGKSAIRYGHAVALTRIIRYWQEEERDIDELHLQSRVGEIIATGLSVTQFQQRIGRWLEEARSPQLNLLDAMEQAALEASARANNRAVFQRHFLQSVQGMLEYLASVIRAFESGALGLEQSPFSSHSPRRNVERFSRLLRECVPHLKAVVPKNARLSGPKACQVAAACDQAELVLHQFDDHSPEAGSSLNGTDG